MVAKIALATCAKDGRSLALTLGGEKGRRMEEAPKKKTRDKNEQKGGYHDRWSLGGSRPSPLLTLSFSFSYRR